MKKVVCIYDYNAINITTGSCYTVVGETHIHSTKSIIDYKIINDIGKEGVYSAFRFRSLDEIRQEKLKELGI
jgi:hypothetical protein